MENVIITGADGFVGSNTVNYFANNGVNVLAIDIIKQPKRIHPNANITYLTLDINNISNIQSACENNKYDTFIHFAWAGSAGDSRTDYNLQLKNALNTVECLKFAKQLGCSRFVCAGSIMEKEVISAVFTPGNKPGMAYIYGMGKLTAHIMCKTVAAQIGIDLLWPMITNAYGAGEYSPRFINTTIRKIINHEPLQFTAATQNYDFIYVTDVAKAFYLIAQKGKPFNEYIIGSSHARPLKEFIIALTSSLDPTNPPIFGDIPYTGTNMSLSDFNTDNLRNDTGFVPEVSFEEGILLTKQWLSDIQ
ncbi:MAG: NAD-dependent epimerase/dehydratase [Bacteroidales bacterium]|nr:NAD-dependent epimerase/dehydratase [Bacteroidales bacterium]